VVSLNWAGSEIVATDVGVSLDLNNNLFHRAMVTITPDGTNAKVNIDIIEDVFGATSTTHNVFIDQAIAGLDLASFPDYRLIAGGRTGGAYMEGDIDNISLTSISSSIPEPTTLALMGFGLAGIGWKRRKTT